MKKFLLLVIAAILNSGPTYTQQPESAVRAEIKFVTGYGFKPGQKIGTVIVSFINNSDRNIYIPEINSISSGDSTGLFRIYKKIGTGYQAIPFYGGELPPPQTDFDGVFACWMPPFVNKLGERVRLKIVKREKPMKEALKKYFEKNLTASDSAILFFENRPLFLKAHEKRPCYFSSMESVIMNQSGEYKVFYNPKLVFKNSSNFPEEIIGYKKFYPTAIKSNTVDIKIE